MILFINACVRADSRTYELAKHLLKYLHDDVKTVTLNDDEIIPLNKINLMKRTELCLKKNFDDEYFNYAKDFKEACTIVIAAPFWDLSFPAVLKKYIETICVNGLTFYYTKDGIPKTLCKACNFYYITTSGGAIFDSSFGYGYLKSLFEGMFEIKNSMMFKSENLDIAGNDPNEIIKKSKEEIDKYFK